MMKLHTRYAQLKEQNAKKFSQKRQDEMTALSAQYSKLVAKAKREGSKVAVKASSEKEPTKKVAGPVAYKKHTTKGAMHGYSPNKKKSPKNMAAASAAHTKIVAQAKRTASTKTPSKPNTIHSLAKPGSKWPTMRTSSTPNGIHPLAKPGSKWPTHALHGGKAKREDAKEAVKASSEKEPTKKLVTHEKHAAERAMYGYSVAAPKKAPHKAVEAVVTKAEIATVAAPEPSAKEKNKLSTKQAEVLSAASHHTNALEKRLESLRRAEAHRKEHLMTKLKLATKLAEKVAGEKEKAQKEELKLRRVAAAKNEALNKKSVFDKTLKKEMTTKAALKAKIASYKSRARQEAQAEQEVQQRIELEQAATHRIAKDIESSEATVQALTADAAAADVAPAVSPIEMVTVDRAVDSASSAPPPSELDLSKLRAALALKKGQLAADREAMSREAGIIMAMQTQQENDSRTSSGVSSQIFEDFDAAAMQALGSKELSALQLAAWGDSQPGPEGRM
jgi:hypothetical protein